jgi:hypothetical protein
VDTSFIRQQPTSPPSHSQTPPRCAPAPPRRAPPLPWIARRRATPGACTSATSAAIGEGGAGSHLSGGPAPCRFLPPPLPTTSTPTSPGEKVPAAHAAGIPRPFVPGAPAARSSAPSYAPPTPAPAAAPRALGLGGVGGSDRAAFTITLYWEGRSIGVTTAHRRGIKKKGEAYSPVGRRGA